jgi:hypothetical protein
LYLAQNRPRIRTKLQNMVQHYSIDRIRRERQAIGCNDHAFFDHTIDLSGMNGSVQARFHHASFTRSFSYSSARPEP